MDKFKTSRKTANTLWNNYYNLYNDSRNFIATKVKKHGEKQEDGSIVYTFENNKFTVVQDFNGEFTKPLKAHFIVNEDSTEYLNIEVENGYQTNIILFCVHDLIQLVNLFQHLD